MMWLIVPLVMGLILSLNEARPVIAFLLGNLYYLSGTIVGFGTAWFWRDFTQEMKPVNN